MPNPLLVERLAQQKQHEVEHLAERNARLGLQLRPALWLGGLAAAGALLLAGALLVVLA